ncbi:MAG: DinB family protein [Pseudobacter sp.]|uniref:DinB family protein n=1 Tax=Pseudobacter sp. TaxID=2045420 RepID=UPI003F81BCDD
MIKHFVKHQLDIISEEPWFGDGFRSKIDQLTDEAAFTKPLPALHSVAELISHSIEWKREGIRQLQGALPQLTMNSPENWKSNEALKKVGWEKLKTDFYSAVNDLVQLLETKEETFLDQLTTDKRYTKRFLLEGLLDHDVYHLGQIAITIKLLK